MFNSIKARILLRQETLKKRFSGASPDQLDFKADILKLSEVRYLIDRIDELEKLTHFQKKRDQEVSCSPGYFSFFS
jgi:hypothetical protein